MNCKIHSSVEAIGECRLCGTAVCMDCMTIVKGSVLCPECVKATVAEAKMNGTNQPNSTNRTNQFNSYVAQQYVLEPKSKFLTFILSFLPGLGHLYLGLTRQGIELMALFFIMAWFASVIPFPFGFIIPVLFFYSIFDALQKRDRIAREEPVSQDATLFKNVDWNWLAGKKWLGWLIIVIGGLMLLKQLGASYRYFYGFNDVIVAVLLIGAGVWVLQKQRGN